ncbi:MAG: ATP-binding protein [Chloroflexaceae bacterium]|nr:ATP-binding protein [Chloroflexaceae bacterium]
MSASACSHASLELSLPSELGYEVIARDAIAAFARRLSIPDERIEDLKTVLCEVCVNAMEHGNSLNPGLRVQIFCRFEDERLVVEVLDQGVRQYTSGARPLSIGEKVAGRGSLRGMGLLLISQLCDEAGFVPWPGPGNRFRFAFHRQPGHDLHG